MVKTKSSKTKDPRAPKRYRSAYILFSIEKRNEIKKQNPGLSPKEIVSELGAQWKSADPETKQHFQKISDAEKVQYEEKSNAYKKSKKDKSANEENNQSMEISSS